VLVDGPVALPVNLPPAELFAGPDGLKAREDLIRSMFSPSTTPEMQEHILAMMLGAPEATAVGAMMAGRDPASWTEDVFSQPVLGIYAERSSMVDREYMKTRFPKLDYSEIPGTGHFLMLEKPAEFNRLLLAFLDKLRFCRGASSPFNTTSIPVVFHECHLDAQGVVLIECYLFEV
jgi:pimeloyl-ACP methyl ester carboxylesterase